MDIKFRAATFDDTEAMYKMLNDYAKEGLMLPRARNSIYENLREYIVAESEGQIVGIGALHFVWDRLGEIRSLAVVPQYKKHGIGKKIVEYLEQEGLDRGVNMFFTLTYQPEFFSSLGFKEVTKDELPQKVWKECIDCPKFPNCDEIAMILSD